MTSWRDVQQAEPDLAARAHAYFTATTNALLATIRRDGSPRLSGIDPTWLDGELWFGSMADARKGADLRRDTRLALHCIPWESRRVTEPADDSIPSGDAKLTGRAVLVTDREVIARVTGGQQDATDLEAPPDADLFRVDIEEVVLIFVEDDLLVIDRWSAGKGRQITRRD